MNIEEILQNNLNGEPLHDSIIIGCAIGIILLFYKSLFGAIFEPFKK